LIGVADQSKSSISSEFIESLGEEDLFTVLEGRFSDLEEKLLAGDLEGLILIPENFVSMEDLGTLEFYVDASQTRQVGVIQKAIDASLISIERKIRNY
jgi:hypothetical protein